MSKHENEFMNAKQVATNEKSAAARMARPMEDKVYALFRAYFQTAERTRQWNVWTAVDWEQAASSAPPELREKVLEAYREALFLPDYSAHALQILRASRGRAWFLTRWSYEEGKHVLALHEWLLRTGGLPDETLRQYADDLLRTYAWTPPFDSPIAVLCEMYLWEKREASRTALLLSLAENANDGCLAQVLGFVLADDEAHSAFLFDVLRLINETHASEVAQALHQVGLASEDEAGAQTALRALGAGH
jgi:acyl-[acyl-carrier-protein] desaturase